MKRIMKMFLLQLSDSDSSKYLYLLQQCSDLKHHKVKSPICMLALHKAVWNVRCTFPDLVGR